MKRAIELRVGICSCSRYYRHRLQNLDFQHAGQNFRLKEVNIPEELQTEQIKKRNCHFFLDLHYDHDMQPSYLVEVILENFQGLPHDRDIKTEIEWEQDEPVPISEVVGAISSLLKGLRPKELKRWLTSLLRPRRQAR